ncbi:hypothetical protein N658DRAFT_201412 [Parathielavia hyrcaniae]|uniref:Uncharacterized protein n=1 Tax=Parathielavia hyrcaniae TaxID=113614 RepID=A0AAN6Q8Y6_9PEZI|nr:hypothetical protein N658DRAFT_201412 [Parathielavia hyrcaniae]
MPAESRSSRSQWMVGCGAGSDLWASFRCPVTRLGLCLSCPPVADEYRSPGPVQECGHSSAPWSKCLVKFAELQPGIKMLWNMRLADCSLELVNLDLEMLTELNRSQCNAMNAEPTGTHTATVPGCTAGRVGVGARAPDWRAKIGILKATATQLTDLFSLMCYCLQQACHRTRDWDRYLPFPGSRDTVSINDRLQKKQQLSSWIFAGGNQEVE